jgi:hypothetical protein
VTNVQWGCVAYGVGAVLGACAGAAAMGPSDPPAALFLGFLAIVLFPGIAIFVGSGLNSAKP